MSKVKPVTNEQLFGMMEEMYSVLSEKYEVTSQKQDEMLGKYDVMLAKYDEMSQKQDKMLKTQNEMQTAISKNTEGISNNRSILSRIEAHHRQSMSLLVSGNISHTDQLSLISRKIIEINAKVDRHEVEMRIIKEA